MQTSKKDYDSIFNAFAVEPLSREFFSDYIKHYAKFCDEIYKQNIFTADETGKKQARDFVKKTLGRIVFLYFLQKKNWLNNEANFLAKLFENSINKNDFYEEYLSLLFFETLNKKRENNKIKFPNNNVYEIPYLNGGLFEKDDSIKGYVRFS